MDVIDQVSAELGHYVYLLVDPRDSAPFYVGKGVGVRFLSHGKAVPEDLREDEGEKVGRIWAIRNAGLEPEIWVARYGLTAVEYTAVEATLIDLLMSFPIAASTAASRYRPLTHSGQLTNARREAAHGHGMVLLDRLVDEFAAPELTTTTPLLLVTFGPWGALDGEVVAGGRRRYGAGFKREWYDPATRDAELDELGIGVSAWWKLSVDRVRRHRIEYAVALYRGVTRGLFRIIDDSWEDRPDGRRAFWFDSIRSGMLYDEVVGPHGHRVPSRAKGAQNPIYYWPRESGT